MKEGKTLHIVMFPWLAIGHLIPFLNLSKCLAQRGHRVTFVSTPRNLQRLPPIPQEVKSLISFVSLPLPHIEPLPDYAESSTDIPPHQSQLLKKAFDLLQQPFATLLEDYTPDWIIYDYASHWLPQLAAKLGISRAFLSLFTAACLSFIGPPSSDVSSLSWNFTVAPKWIPFQSDIAYYDYEVKKVSESAGENESGTSDIIRFRVSAEESDVMAIRSCVELEPEWLNLLVEFYKKPIVPVGLLLPSVEDRGEENNEMWIKIKEWLDTQRSESVVYVAMGTEATLSGEELNELALGLEKSELPFFWVLRRQSWSTQGELEMLPGGFVERIEGRGMVYQGWVPQVKILGHVSVGGFLTHCGWNSVIEGLGLGKVLILFPVLNDQGLNARLMHGKKLGVEVPRNKENGSLTCDAVAYSVRLAMVGEEGELLRANVREMRGLFEDGKRSNYYVDRFVRHLEENRECDQCAKT